MPCSNDCSCARHFSDAACIIGYAIKAYGENAIAVSFNGGKDCAVVLDMLFQILPSPKSPIPLLCVDIPGETTFPEVAECIENTATRYPVKLCRYKQRIKAGIAQFLLEHPTVRAIFNGVRRTDPHGHNLSAMQPADADWPAHMRIHPIIDWPYDTVWHYLLRPPAFAMACKDNIECCDLNVTCEGKLSFPLCSKHQRSPVPYCILYDRGYTSIGCVENTLPNPHLGVNFEANDTELDARQHYGAPLPDTAYQPAYMLSDGCLERAGRR